MGEARIPGEGKQSLDPWPAPLPTWVASAPETSISFQGDQLPSCPGTVLPLRAIDPTLMGLVSPRLRSGGHFGKEPAPETCPHVEVACPLWVGWIRSPGDGRAEDLALGPCAGS